MDSLRRKPASLTPPAPPYQPPKTLSLPSDVPKPTFPPLTPKRDALTPPSPSQSPWKRLLLVFLGLTLCLFIGSVFLIWKGISTGTKIQVSGSTAEAPSLRSKINTLRNTILLSDTTALKGEDRGRINILLLGKAGGDAPGKDLTDTILIASINTKEKRVALLSLPRDLFVTADEGRFAGKINSLYQYSLAQDENLSLLTDTVTDITSEPIDYFFVIDFTGFEQTVDALGGITVEVPKDFYDPRYPGKNYSYETFEIKKGWQKLDGATALKYVRERHDDPEGDFGRAKRQQQVLEAVRNKAASPGTYLNFVRIVKLFESVEENVKTNITLEEMRRFYALSKSLDTHNITNKVVDAWTPESLLRVSHQSIGGAMAFTLVPRTGSWVETRDLSKNIFQLETLALRQEKIATEESSLLILANSSTLSSAQKLARYTEKELGITTSVTYSAALKDSSSQAILVSRSGFSKPYSFDELLARLPVTREEFLPELPANAPLTDFVLVMDEHLAGIFSLEDNLFNQELEEQLSFEHITP